MGPVFEAFVAQEIIKHQIHSGRARQLYYFRDEQGLEVDFVVPAASRLDLIEAKWTKTPLPKDARGIQALQRAISPRASRGFVVHRGGAGGVVAKGVRAVTIEELTECW
jgi:predicted AAA+ superfamily ATPase